MREHFELDYSSKLFFVYGVLIGGFLHFANATGIDSFISIQQSLSSPALVGLLILSSTPLLLIHNIFLGPFTHKEQNYYLKSFCLLPLEVSNSIVKSLMGFILGVMVSYAWVSVEFLVMYALWVALLCLFIFFVGVIVHYSKAQTIEQTTIGKNKFRAISAFCLIFYVFAMTYEVLYRQVLM